MRIKRFESFGSKKLIWIHGLPGSGKTYLANQINENGDFSILDDIIDISLIVAEMNKGSNIILSSPYFENYTGLPFESKLRKILNDSDYEVEEIWFENNPDTCIENIKSREDHKIKPNTLYPEIRIFSSKYKIPEGSKVIPVWSKDV